MSAERRGMGRGLAAILPQAGEIGEPYFREVPIDARAAEPGPAAQAL